ncbi:MAG: branched-chain amino acid ABC transporter permease, partial [Pseudomonadota bacterium]
MLEQQLVNALSLGCVYALFALGFTLVFGVLGVINLSHGAIFMIGAYAALQVVTKLAFPLWASLVAAFFVAGAFGLAIDYLVLKPLRQRNAPHLIPMIATIGLAIFFNSAAQGIFGAENQRFPSDLVPDQQLHFWGVQISVLEVAIIVLSFALMTGLLLVMRKTQLGRALRAIAESPKAAMLLGINVEGLFYLTSFTAAALGGISGVLIALYSNAVFPLMGQPMLHKGIAVII